MRFFTAISLWGMIGFHSLSSEPIRFNVTDLWSEFAPEAMAAYAKAGEFSIECETVGSLLAIERLQAGLIDCALLALPRIEEHDLVGFFVQPVAYSAAMIQVHADNPINELSFESLKSIFDASETERISRWDGLDTQSAFMGVIRAYVVAEPSPLIANLLHYTVFPDGDYWEDIPFISYEEYQRKVQSEPNSICILGHNPSNSNLKSIKISQLRGKPAFQLNASSLYYGDYPIALTYYLVSRSEALEARLLPYFFSEDFVGVMAREGHYALPKIARQ